MTRLLGFEGHPSPGLQFRRPYLPPVPRLSTGLRSFDLAIAKTR